MQGILRLLVLPGCGGACSYGVTVTRPEADTRALGFRPGEDVVTTHESQPQAEPGVAELPESIGPGSCVAGCADIAVF